MAFHSQQINDCKHKNDRNIAEGKAVPVSMSDILASPEFSESNMEESSNTQNPNCSEGTRIPIDGIHQNEKIIVTKASMCDSYPQSPTLPDYIPSVISRSNSDDDSVSTLGSSEETSDTISGRSIFRDYWRADEKSAKSPNRKQSLTTLDTEDTTISRYADSIRQCPDWTAYINDEVFDNSRPAASHRVDSNGYEAYLKVNEAGRTILPSAALLKDTKNTEHGETTSPNNPLSSPSIPQRQPGRRRIFPRYYGPLKPSVNSYGYMYTKPTKGKAPLPFLLHNKKMLRSSLRDRSASLSESTTLDDSYLSSQSRPSVSFEKKVTIHEYEKPVQQYVHDGWSERFAI